MVLRTGEIIAAKGQFDKKCPPNAEHPTGRFKSRTG